MTLQELIVPVNFLKHGVSKRLSLEDFIDNLFSDKLNSSQSTNSNEKGANNSNKQRFILIGEAGSGKSVAMGVIARKIWDINRKQTLLPIFIPFSYLIFNSKVTIENESTLKKVIIDSLNERGFNLRNDITLAEKYVNEHLISGDILLLFDGFDELSKKHRNEVAHFLTQFFKSFPKIPFFISSRKSVWKHENTRFSGLGIEEIEMAEFSPLEVRHFISQWKFKEIKKSPELLADLLSNKPYLQTLAGNPLMLTIIAFIYSQPKRVLPDNRVMFYKECVEALMEAWDNAKELDKANEFETVDKIAVLNKLAYQTIIDASDKDEISSDIVLKIIEDIFKYYGKPVEKREKFLKEIVQNAELLIYLPPDAYKFPHRTFMEYFAANYFLKNNKFDELMRLYHHDIRWQETLLLFCGINENIDLSTKILTSLLQRFKIDETQTLVFRALVESLVVNAEMANEILRVADDFLDVNNHPEIIENIGYIAASVNREYKTYALDILKKLLKKKLKQDDLLFILTALAPINDEEIKTILLEKIREVNLFKFFQEAGQNIDKYIIKILETIDDEKKIDEFILALINANRLELVCKIMLLTFNPLIKRCAAWQLALVSNKSLLFWNMIEMIDVSLLSIEDNLIAERVYIDWNCAKTKPFPQTKEGGIIFYLICYYVAIYAEERELIYIQKHSINIHPQIVYVLSGLLAERKTLFKKLPLLDLGVRPIIYSKKHFIEHWKIGSNNNVFVFAILISICILLNSSALIVELLNDKTFFVGQLNLFIPIIALITFFVTMVYGNPLIFEKSSRLSLLQFIILYLILFPLIFCFSLIGGAGLIMVLINKSWLSTTKVKTVKRIFTYILIVLDILLCLFVVKNSISIVSISFEIIFVFTYIMVNISIVAFYQIIHNENILINNLTNTHKTELYSGVRRSRKNRLLAGVASGIGENMGISPILLRMLFIFITVITLGFFCVVYLLLTLILPKNYDDWRIKTVRTDIDNFIQINILRKDGLYNSNSGLINTPNIFQKLRHSGKLKRSRKNRVFGGVAAGIAEYMGISPILVRISFILLTIITVGIFILVYLLLTLILPKNYDEWRITR